MIKQYIGIGDHNWGVLVYYNVDQYGIDDVIDALYELDCPQSDINEAARVLSKYNSGMTFSNDTYRMSIICISRATSKEEFFNTLVHEAKHVQSHICAYYNIAEDGEPAAYLIGHLVQRMYKYIHKR